MDIPQPIDEFEIYMSWPLGLIESELWAFKHKMRDDAEIEEIQAGLHCLDFMTRKTELSEDLTWMLESAIDEANMRVSLMIQKEDREKTFERLNILLAGLQGSFERTIKGLPEIDCTYEAISKYIELRREKENKV